MMLSNKHSTMLLSLSKSPPQKEVEKNIEILSNCM